MKYYLTHDDDGTPCLWEHGQSAPVKSDGLWSFDCALKGLPHWVALGQDAVAAKLGTYTPGEPGSVQVVEV